MALTQISNVVTFLDKCIRNVNDLVQNSSMVAVNECLIELSNYDIPATQAQVETISIELNNYDIPATQAKVETISNSLGGSINYVTGISSAGEVDFANGGLCYARIDNSVTESTIDLLFPSAGTYTLLLRQGDTAATVTFTSSKGGSICRLVCLFPVGPRQAFCRNRQDPFQKSWQLESFPFPPIAF